MNQASETNLYKTFYDLVLALGGGRGKRPSGRIKCSKETGWSKSAEKNQAEE